MSLVIGLTQPVDYRCKLTILDAKSLGGLPFETPCPPPKAERFVRKARRPKHITIRK
jgi:hypothetical protein